MRSVLKEAVPFIDQRLYQATLTINGCQCKVKSAHRDRQGRAHGRERDQATLVPRPLPDALDLPRDVHRRRRRLGVRLRARVHRPLDGGHDQHPHRHRPHRDDVSAARQGALRGARRRLPRLQDPRPLAGAELAHRAVRDVLPRDHLPAQLPRVHGRAHHDGPRALHRHGDRLEPAGQGRHRVRRRPRRLQQRLPGALLQRLRLGLRHQAAAALRPRGRGRRHHHRADRQERLHLPRHPVHRRHAHPLRRRSRRRAASGTSRSSSRASARSRSSPCCSRSS